MFSVNGSATQTASGENPGGNVFAPYYGADDDYTTFLNVFTNGSGELVITQTPEVANISILNGFQLSGPNPNPIPEPATISLVALGFFGLLVRRRRACGH